jgi:fatty-acyl-CoA synthase
MSHDATTAGDLRAGATFGAMIAAAVARHPTREAFVSAGVSTSYRRLGERISQACQALAQCGLRRGDAVALLAGNAMQTYALLAAVYVSGLRAVTLQTRGGQGDHIYIVNDARARAVIADPEFEERVHALRQACPAVTCWLFTGEAPAGHAGSGRAPVPEDFWAIAQRFAPAALQPVGDADDVVRLAYTGGTTGRPKGVMLTNRGMAAQTLTLLAGTHFADPPRYLCALPMTHGAGGLITGMLVRGGCVVVQPQFHAERFIETFVAERCNATWLVPTALYALLDHPRCRETDWRGLTTLVYSGAPTAPARIREALDVLGPCLVQMYGQTEAPAHVLLLTQQEHAEADPTRLASAGKPFPGVSVALLDDDHLPVRDGEVGEICVRGPLVMAGYWQQPDMTAAALAGGWLHTGDLARLDDDGFFHIVDRKKDMLISGGFNVYPKEIETVLARHPAVSQSAVVGLPDSRWGEIVAAFVMLRDGGNVDAQTLMDLVRVEKGAVCVPRHLEFVDTLPLTSVGKVDKRALRERAGAQRSARQ